MEFDTLLKQYLIESKTKEQKKMLLSVKNEKQAVRASKIQTISDKKFEQDLLN